ncbi:MAG: hypothetical protein P3W87_003015, partial [Gammaproteobacteria bacterium]|nr:hypothetical protein [Gammaproteobacteria bacterium]
MDYTKIAEVVTSFATSGTFYVYILALATGVVLVLSAIYSIIVKGTSAQAASATLSWGGIVGRLLIGTLLATMGWTLSMWFHTTGEPTELQSALAYVQSSTGQSEVTRAIWEAIRAWCVFI